MLLVMKVIPGISQGSRRYLSCKPCTWNKPRKQALAVMKVIIGMSQESRRCLSWKSYLEQAKKADIGCHENHTLDEPGKQTLPVMEVIPGTSQGSRS